MAVSRFLLRSFMLMGIVMIVVGCANGEKPEPTRSPLSPVASPISDSPQPSPSPAGVRFNLDEPVVAEAMRVSGQGPSGIPLQVVDVTAGGEVLGSGRINSNGQFAIKLGKPIPATHVIGIQLGTAKDPDTWPGLWEMRGDGARAIPQVGDFFDSAVSVPE